MASTTVHRETPSTLVFLPVTPAEGCHHGTRPLYEARIDGELHVLWELEDGRVACASAVCPHKPMLGALLNIRAAVEGNGLRCLHHGNLYSGETGLCTQILGQRDPGALTIFYGWREGDTFVIDMSTRSGTK